MGRYRFVAIAVAVTGVCGALAPGAWTALPPQSTPLRYELENCDGPTGSLTGFKQPGEAAALHLTNGGKYIFMEAFPTGDEEHPFFTTPGFDHNNLALVTCTLSQPLQDVPTTVRGLITPVR